jgi:para-nitrobenzyl esterase
MAPRDPRESRSLPRARHARWARWLVLWSCIALAAGCDGDPPRNTPDARPPGSDAPLVDAAPPVDSSAAPDPTHVQLADGEIRGSIKGASRQFLGIPYARPPTGELRWKAPQKPVPWTAPLEAKAFGKRCAQLANTTLQNPASNDEDCLHLNVWTPSPVPLTQLPVMVWIHGGGNVNGSAAETVPFLNTGVFYSGEFLAGNHNVIVVTINYRLGLFGFFAHPELAAEGVAGNQGLLDQRFALQWVHDNIARFGGDPSKVTIFGESAGSQDVCLHVASPGSRDLFHRVIGQSGGCTTFLRTRAEAEAVATSVATELGCAGPGQLACLRGKTAMALLEDPAIRTPTGDGFGPNVDGAVIPDQPRTLYDAGQIAKVPYLLGSNTDEGTLFVLGATITTAEDYRMALTARFGAGAGAVEAQYPYDAFAGGLPSQGVAALARAFGDSALVCTTFDTALRVREAGAPVYLYNFDIPVDLSDVRPELVLGATHGAELTYVFGTSPVFTAEERAASARIQRYWTSFARTGDPNGSSDLLWPARTASQDLRVNFELLQTTIITDFRTEKCAFWRGVYASRFPPN